MNWVKWLAPVVIGMVGGILADLKLYMDALADTPFGQPDPPFRWKLFIVRAVYGGLVAVGGVAGFNSIPDA